MPGPYPLWDLPTRLFHWSLVLILPLSWWSAETARFELHQWLGYAVIVLVVFRIAWGFLGSPHSRFGDFLVGPRRVLAYLRSAAAPGTGHNPLGGWSVLGMLLLLLVQGVSGLFNSDDVFYKAPWYYGADARWRDTLGLVHELAFDALLALLALHIAAVAYHQWWKGEQLLQPMLRGFSEQRQGRDRAAPLWLALVIFALASLALWACIALAPAPPPVFF